MVFGMEALRQIGRIAFCIYFFLEVQGFSCNQSMRRKNDREFMRYQATLLSVIHHFPITMMFRFLNYG